jgi:hypothetical protein
VDGSFSVAPGTIAALSDLSDNRAYYLLTGDLSQMGTMLGVLQRAGFPVVRSNVYPGFAKGQEDEYKRALQYLFDHRTPGWWNQRTALIKYGICTAETYMDALQKEH